MTITKHNLGAHLLVIPYLAQGHMIPLLDLTQKLSSHQGLKITILVTPKNLPLLTNLLSSNPLIESLVLPFPHPTNPSIPIEVENDKDLPSEVSNRFMMRALGDLRNPLFLWFKSHSSPPTAILSDMFLGWTHYLACQLGIRRFVFSPSGALALSVMYSLWQDLPKLDCVNGDEQTKVITFNKILNCPTYHWWQLSPTYRSYIEGDSISEFIKDGFHGNISSWGLVINSCNELEQVYLEYLKNELGHDRVWGVGPLVPAHDDKTRGGSSTISTVDLFSWLDACDDHSVVYVCFGSQTVLTNKQMEALALGLEKSGVNFIWCLKEQTMGHASEGYNMIPRGFEDRAAGRGLVIKGWAPQVSILSHRAVSVFVTHCGWNSIIEGIIGGVAMVTWPMRADQFANATLVVEELKVAVRGCEGANTIPNSDKLGKVVAELLTQDNDMRDRVMKLREGMLEAINEGGGSSEDLVELGKHILNC